MNARIKAIRSLFGSTRIACDSEFKPAHDPKNGQFTSGSGGGSSQKDQSLKKVLSYRASKLEAVNAKLTESIKKVKALGKLGDKVDDEYAAIAEKQGVDWNSDWQREYLKNHPQLPSDVKYYEEYGKLEDHLKSIGVEYVDVDDIEEIRRLNKKKIRKVKKKITGISSDAAVRCSGARR